MSYSGPFTMIIPEGVRANSADVFRILDPDSGGAATFSVPLSASGLPPATHWACRTLLETATHNALVNMTTVQFKSYVDSLAATRGRAPAGSVSFKNSLVMSATNADTWAFIAAQGLKPVAEPEA